MSDELEMGEGKYRSDPTASPMSGEAAVQYHRPAPKPIVIHRNHTFTYDGELYRVSRGGDYGSGFGWEIWRDRDGAFVYDDFDTLAQVRQYVNEAATNGWPLVEGDKK